MSLLMMSDIHGEHELLKEMIDANVDFSKDTLVLLGDYVDGTEKSNSYETLKYIYSLQKENPKKVVVLLGNHDAWLCNWVFDKIFSLSTNLTPEVNTILDFMDYQDNINIITNARSLSGNIKEYTDRIIECRKKCIKEKHFELLNWLRNCPLYYETTDQIMVHAGVTIFEESEIYWKDTTTIDDFLMQFPADLSGYSHKTIIAGHIGTNIVSNIRDFHYCYGYGKRVFIDATVQSSRRINLLKYDKKTYTEFIKNENGDWIEQEIKWKKKEGFYEY